MSNEELERLIEERTAQLNKAHQQLQVEIAERQRLETSLRHSEQKLHPHYNHLPVPTYIWQKVEQGFVLIDYNNAAFHSSQGHIAHAIGQTVQALYPDIPQLLEDLWLCFTEQTNLQRQKQCRWFSEEVSQDLTFSYVFMLPDLIILHTEEITHYQQREKELNSRVLQQSALAKLGHSGLIGTDISTLMNEAVNLISQTLQLEYCLVLELLTNNHAFLLKAGVGWQKGLVGTALIGAEENSLVGYTLRSQQPVIIHDFRIDVRFTRPPLLHNHKVVSGISIMIPGKERAFGVLGAYTTQERLFNEEDIYFLQMIANILAAAIEREKVESELELMKRAIDASTNGIIITDATLDNPIIYANSGFAKMTGYSPEEILGHNCRLLQGPETDSDTICQLRNTLNEGRECHAVIKNYRKDGTPFWNKLHIAPIRNTQGHLTHFIGIQTDITEHKQIQEALTRERSHLAAAQKMAHVGSWELDLTTQLFTGSEETYHIFGLEPRKPILVFSTYQQYIHPEDRTLWEACFHQMVNEKLCCERELRIMQPGGTTRHVIIKGQPIVNAEAQVIRLFGTLLDITERVRFEEELRQSKQFIQRITDTLPQLLYIYNLAQHRHIYVNHQIFDILGYQPEEVERRGEQFFRDTLHPDDLNLLHEHSHRFANIVDGEVVETEYRIKHANGSWHWLRTREVVFTRNADNSAENVLGTAIDITDHKQAQEALRLTSLYDALTGLPNRVLFMDRLTACVWRAKQHRDYLFGILFLDLDRFKVVNDSLGHTLGDRMLIAIACRLGSYLRPSDTLARLGGDEFTILLDDIKDVNDATKMAERIREELSLPFNLDGHKVFTSVSIGIALSSTGYDRPEHLLRDADIAMYRAKERGRARYEVFDKVMHAHALQRLQLETDLRRAIERQEFMVYYQPIISLNNGKLTGFEALIRWQHLERGFIPPDEFIPVAEETGLIIPIGEWVLRESCRQMHSWHTQFPNLFPLQISVNISGKQLKEPDLIEQIDLILLETGLAGSSLKLEITESVLMENADAVTSMLLDLRTRNIQLSIDDFGTGYSSLSYLHRFPVNTLKIDRSFVSQMVTDDDKLEIVRAIVTLAHTLRMNVIAEGVETRLQWVQLRILGCEYGQGYFFSRPLPPDAAGLLLAAKPQW